MPERGWFSNSGPGTEWPQAITLSDQDDDSNTTKLVDEDQDAGDAE